MLLVLQYFFFIATVNTEYQLKINVTNNTSTKHGL